jgi:hypothetical protein
VIWNPPVSAALIKMATAMALTLTTTSPRWHIAVAAMLAWMAVQAHLSALFVAAPMLAAISVQRFYDRATAVRRSFYDRSVPVLMIAATIAVLQIPFVISILREPSGPVGPSSAIASITNPKAVRPWFAYDSVSGITGNLVWTMPDGFSYAIATLVAGAIVAYRYRRDPVLLGASIGGLITATLLFTTSTRNYDSYWFLTMTTALTLTYAMTITAIPSQAAIKWIGIALLLFVAWRQPARIADSTGFFKYPQYGPMVRGSRELVMRAPVVRDIKVTFDVHPTMDRQFIYKILGGRIDGSALYTAVINADGTVKLE